jgi:hypothetical protein
MTMASTLPRDGRTVRRAARADRVACDLAILAAALAVCGVHLLQGGLEAMAGAAVGAVIAGRSAPDSAAIVSGAFAGLWIGALAAAFFHSALATIWRAMF